MVRSGDVRSGKVRQGTVWFQNTKRGKNMKKNLKNLKNIFRRLKNIKKQKEIIDYLYKMRDRKNGVPITEVIEHLIKKHSDELT